MTPDLHQLPSNVSQVMRLVIFALVPGTLLYVAQTGWGGVLNICLAIIAAIIFEAIATSLRNNSALTSIGDYSAIVTGLLIALCLPPLLPWWIPVIAVAVAIVLAKHCYGGLGQNVFNPAMAGYAIVLVSYPRDLSLWPIIPNAFNLSISETLQIVFNGGLINTGNWDALTGATALDKARELYQQGATQTTIAETVGGYFGAKHSEWINTAYLAGGLALIATRVISWHIPIGVLATLLLCSLTHNWIAPNTALPIGLQLFGGATMLCAFFIATDPVSAAASNSGRLFYAVGIGLLIFLIRTYGSYPDSIAFAVLLMNCAVPMIDRIEPTRWFRQQ